jgi:hypothetical protein
MSDSYQDGYVVGAKDAESGAILTPPNVQCPYDGRTKAARDWLEGYSQGYEDVRDKQAEQEKARRLIHTDCGHWVWEDSPRLSFVVAIGGRGFVTGSTVTLCPRCLPQDG